MQGLAGTFADDACYESEMDFRSRLLSLSSPLAALGLLLVLAGCPETDPKGKPGPAPSSTTTGACIKVGQSCEVSTGKLGTCVQKDDCKEPNGCFVCQSQH
jgi:hypothetical protein